MSLIRLAFIGLIILALFLGSTTHINANLPPCSDFPPEDQFPGLDCEPDPPPPATTEESNDTAPGEPDGFASPDTILPENNAYTDNGTAPNGQGFAALGGPAFVVHPFLNLDGSISLYHNRTNQVRIISLADLQIPGVYPAQLFFGSFVLVIQPGECYFSGADQNGVRARSILPIDCRIQQMPEEPTPIPTVTPTPSPTIGDTAPREGLQIPRNITGCALKDGPSGNVLPFTFVGEAVDVGQSADGTSLLVAVSDDVVAWVDVEDCPQAF